MKLKYMIPALCICTCTAMPEMLHAQDDSLKKDSTERPFNAMDYVLQKRYIPQKRSEQQPAGQEFLPVGNGRCEQAEGQFFTAGMVQRWYCPD